jgi:hypothetical protein
MGLFDAFKKEEVVGTKILACTLDGARFQSLLNSDSQQYKRLYPATSANVFAGVPALMQAIAQSYDVVHFYGDVSPDGNISGGLSGAQLLDACCAANVKLLWIACDNKAENYAKAFDTRGKKINLITTLRRLGPYFPLFLGNLLEKTSAGEPLAQAWEQLNPKGGDSVQPDTPECGFFGGRKIILKK